MYCNYEYRPFNELMGKTFRSVERIQESSQSGNEAIVFTCEDGRIYHLTHKQDCCESVWIEDICGDLEDLVGAPILIADESFSSDSGEIPPKAGTAEWVESCTWSFYRISTIRGSVQIRFFGTSNGYYSESASLLLIENAEDCE